MEEDARCVLSWSGGKDCAYTYNELLQRDMEVESLLVTVSSEHQRASHHGVRNTCLQKQAENMDVSMDVVEISADASNHEYEDAMQEAIGRYESNGIGYIAFGDIHLEDIKRYREKQLEDSDLRGSWPIWGLDTEEIILDFIEQGFRSIVVAVNTDHLGENWLGREIDRSFIEDLPGEVDPCGENGEFHTYVFNTPYFKDEIDVSMGKIVSRCFDDTEIKYLDLTTE